MDHIGIKNRVQSTYNNGISFKGINCQPIKPDISRMAGLERDIFVSLKPKPNKEISFCSNMKNTVKNLVKNLGLN